MRKLLVKIGAFTALSCGLAACGRGSDPQSSSPFASRGVEQDTTFATWCADWNLSCPTGEAPNVPTAETPWTAAQWRSLLATIKAIGDSPSIAALSRTELDDATLDRAATVFDAGELLARVKDRLDESKLQKATMQQGSLTLTAAEAAEFRADSGLLIRNQPTTALTVTSAYTLAASGAELASENDHQDTLAQAAFTGTNVMSWAGTETAVTGMPIQFFFQEVAGIPATAAPMTAQPGYADLVPLLAPLKTWLTAGQRDLDLRTAAFTQFATHVPNLIDDPALRQPVTYILQKLTTLTSTATSRRQNLVKAVATQQFQCRLGDQAMITFEAQFGLTNLTALSSNSARMSFFGILVKPLSGIVRPNIRLTDIDFEPTRIVVRNVPIIGTYVIDMTQPSSGMMSLNCG